MKISLLEPVSATQPGYASLVVRHPAQLVGNTPVLRVEEPFAPPGRGFYAKLEGANPGGIKDRSALHMVREARRRGDLALGAPIIESSSGTFGLGLALAGLTYGHPVTVVSDPGMEAAMLRLLTMRGAHIDQVVAPHREGGWQTARRDRVAELLEQAPGAYCPDQYHNPDNVAAYRPLATELIAQLGHIDVLVAAVGTGGHSAGVAAVLRETSPGLALIGVDAIGSTIFGQPACPRLMRGLGSSMYSSNVDYTAFDEVHWVAPAEAVWACRQLARRHHTSGAGVLAPSPSWPTGPREPCPSAPASPRSSPTDRTATWRPSTTTPGAADTTSWITPRPQNLTRSPSRTSARSTDGPAAPAYATHSAGTGARPPTAAPRQVCDEVPAKPTWPLSAPVPGC